MKKNFLYAMMSAVALTGAVSFSACSSSDEVVDNPDYNPVDNTVKTQFALSLSRNVSNPTRQTEGIVQMANTPVGESPVRTDFRGITNISLIPFGSEPGASSTALGPVIGPLTMNKVSTTPTSSESSYNNTTNNAVVYTNIIVPTTTSHFLFYGQATEASNSTKFQNGALTVAGLYGSTAGTYDFVTPNSITFTPVGIYNDLKDSDQDFDDKEEVGENLINLLNSLLTDVDGETTPKTWGQYTSSDNSLLKDLHDAYIQLTTASSKSVAAMLVDLYTSLEGLASTADGTKGKKMAVALRKTIKEDGFGDEAVEEDNFVYPGYPGNIGMPDGAARLSYSNESGESFALAQSNSGNYPTYLSDPDDPNSVVNYISVTSYTDYVYPANLQYFVKSDIVTSTVKQSDNFASKSNWTGCTDLYTNGTSVTSTTKSVALKNEIQYGVGNLNIIVNALDENNNKTYYDRNGEVIDLTEDTPFALTGILVGSQGPVNYQFVPASQGAMTIYDNVINSANLSKTVAANNYTLGLQTMDATGDGTIGVVNIALELQNNTGKDFMGKDGLIPAGGKFYLAGTLNPKDNTGDDHTASTVENVLSVFKQDYITKVRITIKEGTLSASGDSAEGGFADATNGVPDLRTPQTEVCFSVDLTWKGGLEFDINI